MNSINRVKRAIIDYNKIRLIIIISIDKLIEVNQLNIYSYE